MVRTSKRTKKRKEDRAAGVAANRAKIAARRAAQKVKNEASRTRSSSRSVSSRPPTRKSVRKPREPRKPRERFARKAREPRAPSRNDIRRQEIKDARLASKQPKQVEPTAPVTPEAPPVIDPASPTPTEPAAPAVTPTQPPSETPETETPVTLATENQISYGQSLGITFPPGTDIATASLMISEAVDAQNNVSTPDPAPPTEEDPNKPRGSNSGGWPPIDYSKNNLAGIDFPNAFATRALERLNEAKRLGYIDYAEVSEMLKAHAEGQVTKAMGDRVWQLHVQTVEANSTPDPVYVNQGSGSEYIRGGVDYYQQGTYRSVTDPKVTDLVSYNGELMSESRRRRRRSQDRAEEKQQTQVEALDETGVVPMGEPINLIRLEASATGLAAYIKGDGILNRIAKIMTSPVTTGVLATVLGALVTFGGVGVGSIATTSQVGFKGATVSSRFFVGKSASSGVSKLFSVGSKSAQTASRFATNTKSLSLTGKFMKGAGLTLAGAGALATAIGTYPFAGFIQEEALQTTGLQFFESMGKGDIQGMEDANKVMDEILAARGEISKVPFVNVMQSLNIYFDAVEKKVENNKRLVGIMQAIQDGDQLDEFEQAHLDARIRDLDEKSDDAKYFSLIRNGNYAEAAKMLARLQSEATQ